MKELFTIIVMMLCWCSWAEKYPFERYQSILDRQPFGAPPQGFDPMRNPNEVTKNDYKDDEAELTPSQEEIQKAIHFSVLNVEPDGTIMVGFSDKSDAKVPKHYYLAVGSERDGWLVKSADAAVQSMTIEKGGVEVEMTLGDSTQGGAKGGGGKMAKGAKEKPTPKKTLANSNAVLHSRRARREEEEKQRELREARLREAEEERQREEAERAEREANEKAQREQDREAMREQLNAISDELRRTREERRRREEEKENNDEEGGDEDE